MYLFPYYLVYEYSDSALLQGLLQGLLQVYYTVYYTVYYKVSAARVCHAGDVDLDGGAGENWPLSISLATSRPTALSSFVH